MLPALWPPGLFRACPGRSIGGQFLVGKVHLSLQIGELALPLVQFQHLGVKRPANEIDLLDHGLAALARRFAKRFGGCGPERIAAGWGAEASRRGEDDSRILDDFGFVQPAGFETNIPPSRRGPGNSAPASGSKR